MQGYSRRRRRGELRLRAWPFGRPNFRVKRLLAVAHFRRWIGATPPEVFLSTFLPPRPSQTYAAGGMPTAVPYNPRTMPATPARAQFRTTVSRNDSLCREHYLLSLRVPGRFPATEPGQFIQIFCRDPDWLDTPPAYDPQHDMADWSLDRSSTFDDPDLLHPAALIRRPFSLAGRRELPEGDTELDIIHRVVGVGTSWLAERRDGDPVSILGPLGNRFSLPAKDDTALLIGGGVGIPPMLYLAERLAREGRSGIPSAGALSRHFL